jgi:hypothetical protein
MGKGEYLSPYAWGRLLSTLLEHDLSMFLSGVDVKTLGEVEARTQLYEQLRSFMKLKNELKSREPRPNVLRPAHEALLDFAARLFMVAHQALLNDAGPQAEKKRTVSENPRWQGIAPAPSARFPFMDKLLMVARQVLPRGRVAEPTKHPASSYQVEGQHRVAVASQEFLLEWQLVRLKAARERLILELADLSERHESTFRKLRLSEAVAAEVESARLRVSSVWEKIPNMASLSTVRRQPRAGKDAEAATAQWSNAT